MSVNLSENIAATEKITQGFSIYLLGYQAMYSASSLKLHNTHE